MMGHLKNTWVDIEDQVSFFLHKPICRFWPETFGEIDYVHDFWNKSLINYL